MNAFADLLIIGAGPAGMAAALAAAPSGARIVVLDDNPLPGGQIWRDGPQASLPAQALLARLGGDEFVAVLPEAAHATEHAQQLLAALAAPLPTCDSALSASIGMACAPTDGHDAQTLVQHADLAMYAAKRNGRNQLQRWPVAALARN